MDFKNRYSALNAQQKQAVDHIDGPLMVVAGPGTGKTELLSMRTANILRRTDTLPENILCLTFTESGATAMRRRLFDIIGQQAYKVTIHTFHSFGSDIINQYGEYFYQGADFRPASDLSAYELLRSIFDSLDFSDPLSSKMNDEYTHLRDSLTTISELKKSGLTNEELLKVLDANEAVLDAIEPDIAAVFDARVSKKTIDALRPVAQKIASLPISELPPGVPPLANVLAIGLAHAVDDAESTDSTKPITAWKNAHLEKDENGKLIFKDRRYTAKLRALSFIYYQYLMKMQEAELYDFDDMVLRVVHAMEVFPELRYNLQERYLYIMVDEFQDTNLAQARILYDLTSTPTGDAPNIMVVGDDDQAIYSFQGAEIGNILGFRDKYETVKTVTLTDNYRSAAPILETSRQVITQGNDRLERYIDEIDKNLTPHYESAESGVVSYQYARIEDERRGLVNRIEDQISSGVEPGSIVVLARRHHELAALLPYFSAKSLRVNYERRDNVLESDIIMQLVLLSRIMCHLANGEVGQADALLPQLIAHPAWGFDASEVWKLSLEAYKHHSSWLEQMAVMPRFVPLHGWLIRMSRLVVTDPAERVIDRLIGTPDEDRGDGTFHSPIYSYFFTETRQSDNPDSYVTYLEAIRSIRSKLREYRPDQPLNLHDFLEFIELHTNMGSIITSVRIRSDQANDAVNLMTAHKSKGLEFEHVHIIGAVDTAWGERVRSRSRLISYPENLPIKPSGDSIDERLRLFYVAMTRAKSTLSISHSLADENGRELLQASFLTGTDIPTESIGATNDIQVLTTQLRQEWYQPFTTNVSTDMKSILAPTLENYKLSVTHLTSFLDVTRGGPERFLVKYLLHFPVSKASSAQYGSAIHTTLQKAHSHLTANGNRKPVEDVLQDFEHALAGYHLPEQEFNAYHIRGTAALSRFLTERYESFMPTQKTEVSFSNQQSMVGTAMLTGALDLIDIDQESGTMTVTDYKTGSPTSKWHGKTDGEKLKLHSYRQQLMFYKLLVEASRDYGSYTVTAGNLQFVEPSKSGNIYNLDLTFDREELAEFAELVKRVYACITTMNLPGTSDYPETYAGVLAFEQDILNDKY